MSTRVRPSDIPSHRMNRRLATKRQYELRFGVWADQAELIQEWCDEHGTNVTIVVRKLLNFWLHQREAKRQQIMKEY